MPVIILAVFPLVAVIGAVVSLRSRNAWGVLTMGVIELVWAVITFAMVGFAIGLRSG